MQSPSPGVGVERLGLSWGGGSQPRAKRVQWQLPGPSQVAKAPGTLGACRDGNGDGQGVQPWGQWSEVQGGRLSRPALESGPCAETPSPLRGSPSCGDVGLAVDRETNARGLLGIQVALDSRGHLPHDHTGAEFKNLPPLLPAHRAARGVVSLAPKPGLSVLARERSAPAHGGRGLPRGGVPRRANARPRATEMRVL